MDYKEQIKSPKWQRRRLEILQRDDFTCQICGCKDKMLHVHHTAYERNKMIWEYPDEMLITMCNECHSLEHNMDNLITKLLHMIKTRGVTNHEIITLLDFIDTKLFNGESDAILKITGEYGIQEITNYPYVKQLENRRNLIKNGTAKQNRS